MANDSGFKVYRAKHLFNLSPLVITTAGIEGETTLYSEYFILIKDKQNVYPYELRLLQRGNVDDRKAMGIDEEFMFAEALSAANAKLANFLYEKYEETKDDRYLLKDFELVKQDNLELMSSYLRSEYDNEFKRVVQQSNSEKLAEYLTKILKFPKMTSRDKF